MLGLQGYADSSDEEADAGASPEAPAQPAEEEDEPSPSSANLLQALASPQANGAPAKEDEEEDAEVEEPVAVEDPDDVSKVELPKEPAEPVSADRLATVRRLLDLQAQGRTINAHMKNSAEYRNPYILEKIIKVFEIDETATHVPAE